MRLLRTMEDMFPGGSAEIFRTAGRLGERFHPSGSNFDLAVLLAVNEEDLHSILTVRFLLADTRSVIVLPSRDERIISKTHRLRPRFFAYADRDFTSVNDGLMTICQKFSYLESLSGSPTFSLAIETKMCGFFSFRGSEGDLGRFRKFDQLEEKCKNEKKQKRREKSKEPTSRITNQKSRAA
jgi:hypothetical protein